MVKNIFKRGFTLIELLVVIAIIGILASVVLASLNSAREKGEDAAVKANLSGIRAQAELTYDDEGGCYGDGTGCAAGAFSAAACAGTADTIFNQPQALEAIGAATAAGGLNACSSTANQDAWAIAVQMSSDGLLGWCVDSTGKSQSVTVATDNQAGITGEVSGGACVE